MAASVATALASASSAEAATAQRVASSASSAALSESESDAYGGWPNTAVEAAAGSPNLPASSFLLSARSIDRVPFFACKEI